MCCILSGFFKIGLHLHIDVHKEEENKIEIVCVVVLYLDK